MIGTATMPMGSRLICGVGSSVTCPPRYAVSSPNFNAVQACAASCAVVEKRNTMYHFKPSVPDQKSPARMLRKMQLVTRCQFCAGKSFFDRFTAMGSMTGTNEYPSLPRTHCPEITSLAFQSRAMVIASGARPSTS